MQWICLQNALELKPLGKSLSYRQHHVLLELVCVYANVKDYSILQKRNMLKLVFLMVLAFEFVVDKILIVEQSFGMQSAHMCHTVFEHCMREKRTNSIF